VFLGAMIILLLLLAMLHDGLTNSEYAVLKKHLLKQLGKTSDVNDYWSRAAGTAKRYRISFN